MFARTFARITAALPSSFKYRLTKLRRIYTFAMGLGQPVIEVQTRAGALHWKIDELTSQTFLLGTYEPYMQEAFLRFVRPGAVVYDIGAHAGFHTLFCGLLVGPSGRVIAFEPNPENRVSIEGQIRVNPGLPVSVLPYALSNRCGTVGLDTSISSSQCHVTEVGGIRVEAWTMDALVSEGHIPPPRVIKLDVEGHEPQVIEGSMSTLQNYNPVILCDYNDSTTLPSLSGLLVPLGYSISEGPPIIALPRVGLADREEIRNMPYEKS